MSIAACAPAPEFDPENCCDMCGWFPWKYFVAAKDQLEDMGGEEHVDCTDDECQHPGPICLCRGCIVEDEELNGKFPEFPSR